MTFDWWLLEAYCWERFKKVGTPYLALTRKLIDVALAGTDSMDANWAT